MIAQVSDPVQALLLTRAYLLALFSLSSMVYLEYRTDRNYGASVYYALGVFALIFIILGTGVLSYDYPFTGAILSAGFSVLAFLLGLGVGRVVWGREHVIEELPPERHP